MKKSLLLVLSVFAFSAVAFDPSVCRDNYLKEMDLCAVNFKECQKTTDFSVCEAVFDTCLENAEDARNKCEEGEKITANPVFYAEQKMKALYPAESTCVVQDLNETTRVINCSSELFHMTKNRRDPRDPSMIIRVDIWVRGFCDFRFVAWNDRHLVEVEECYFRE